MMLRLFTSLLIALMLAENAAASADWRVGFGTVGPLRLGMTLNQVNTTLNDHIAPPSVPEADPSGRCFERNPSGRPGVVLMFWDQVLIRVDVHKSGVSTTEGIGVDDPESAVFKAYGRRVVRSQHQYDQSGSYLTVLDGGKTKGLRFEIVEGKVGTFDLGTVEAIQLVEGCA
jgi:hypothetical protein